MRPLAPAASVDAVAAVMTVTTPPRTTSTIATAWLTVAITLVWITYATIRGDTTVHLGPLIVPFVPVATGYGAPRAAILTWFATALAAGAIVVLSTTGNLDGPAIGPFSDATIESVVVLAISAPAALVLASLSRRNPG